MPNKNNKMQSMLMITLTLKRCTSGIKKNTPKYFHQINQKTEIQQLTNMLDTAQNDTDINSSILSFTDLMDSVCAPLFGRQPSEHNQFDQNDNAHSQNHTIFDQTCNNKRSIFYKNLNIYIEKIKMKSIDKQ